ncbi:plasminogen-like [Mercenaria mercenaria]|uniref:plasminogen-like n=1 Tax=Mercenaria mercenaria TaxID=6596 RepID=UPI00234E6ACA|nr:plasminogen-like [Mercenaria mercenaria]
MKIYCSLALYLTIGYNFGYADSESVPCGVPKFQPVNNRVVGGHEARPGSWPWMVMLAEVGVLVCGGSILNEQFVLTAAHCFEDELSRNPIRWQAYVGKHHLNYEDASESKHHVKEIIIHPGFQNTSMKNDIALLRLQEPIIFDDYKKPICVPPTRRRVVPFNSYCYTTGWGDTRGTGDRTVLNQVMLPIVNDYFCGRADWYGQSFIRGVTFCAGYAGGGRDACTGDSGGPFNCKKDGKWYVQGVTSWGYDCAQPKWPGIYTDVSKYGTWIRETMLNSGVPLND